MANEYLQRTPTSSGNRKVWTWSGWVKLSNTSTQSIIRTSSSGTSAETGIYISGSKIQVEYYNGPGQNYYQRETALRRDFSSWIHILVSNDSTKVDLENERTVIYVNGIRTSGLNADTPLPVNTDTFLNLLGRQVSIGSRPVSSPDQYFEGEMTDLFLVDGQALTPDVFGFYKDGDGYQSSGTSQATDFRPGQWSPRAPKSIKYTINRRGGFGVNGFYLPMNDSSNPGADFHCAPNSIITLKGEDLPQPRNGAPTTSDAFVSQLRSDPYAANIVLAVPGASTATGSDLITNGQFHSDVSGWTAQSAVISWVDGELHVDDSANAGAYSSANQAITTVIGQRYTLMVDIISTSATPSIAVYSSGWSAGSGDVFYSTYSSTGKKTISFVATSTQSTISLQTSGTSLTVYNNVVCKQEDAPRDYSADIKGSGTNKTLTAAGDAGVGYELGGYYGSAMTFDNDGTNASGNTDVINVPNSSDFVFTGDVTMECWIYPAGSPTTASMIMGQWQSGAGTDRNFQINFDTSNRVIAYFNSSATNYDTGTSSALALNQWHHIAVEKYGSNMTLYLNGVAVGVNPSTPTAGNTSTVPFTIGSESDGSNGADYGFNGKIQDVRVYKGLAKYKGGFDVPKPYTPVGIEAFRTTADTCKNNFATLNPLRHGGSTNNSLSLINGNLRSTHNQSGQWQFTQGTMAVSSGKWYYECEVVTRPTTTNENYNIGFYNTAAFNGGYYTLSGNLTAGVRNNIFYVFNDTSQTTYGTKPSNGDVLMFALDVENGKFWVGLNGVWMESGNPELGINPSISENSISTNEWIPHVSHYAYSPPYGVFDCNFGQNPSFSGTTTAGTNADGNGKGLFKYAPPTGFLALCEDNLPTPAIADPGEQFKCVLWTGDGNDGRSITGVGFKPDFVWIKERTSLNTVSSHRLFDSVRGAGNVLLSDGTTQELYRPTDFRSFDENGFSVGTSNATNETGSTFVAWCWKAGGAAVTNSDGDLTSQVSVNQDAGFSIVKFTGQGGSSSATVGHGLGKKPAFWIYKPHTNTTNWYMYHQSLGASAWLNFSTTQATTGNAAAWGGVEPTSTVLTHGSGLVNQGSCILYAWTEIEGFSKFGSYVGNASDDGPFVYCGFKPAWVMIKITTGTNSWVIYDSSRNSTNMVNNRLRADLSNIEDAHNGVDFLSNGFKLRDAGSSSTNASQTYIFMAFAESPFQTANAK